MSLYLVRHGQTDYNIANRIQGRLDIPLNEVGIQQAKDLKEKLKGIHLDRIVCSPLSRALETANIVNEGRDLPILIDERVIEQCYGDLDGTPRSGAVYHGHRESVARRYPNGEGYLDVAARIYPFLKELNEKYRGEDILLVCHGGISRVIRSYFEDLDNETFFHHGMENCQVLKFEFKD